MSKIDELIGVYIEASSAVVWEAEKRDLCPMTLDMQRAGIIAVVTALRDELVREFERCDCCSGIEHVEPFFEEILAPREGGSREAGVPTSDGGTELDRTSGPAPAAPAPVCEWLDDGNPRKRRRNSCGLQGANQSWAGMNWVCTGCLRPIKFTEAQR